jgi:hypothetical protein
MGHGGLRMSPRTSYLVGLLAATFLLLAVPTWATVADDLCSPLDDPCVVSGPVTIDPGSILLFGVRTLQLAPGAVVSWTDELVIHAAACDFRAGSTLRETVPTPGPHFLYLDCAGASTLAGTITTRGAGMLVPGAARSPSRVR